MNMQPLLEEKHVLLKTALERKLRRKNALELEISMQFEKLKQLEITLEKQNHAALARA